MADIATLGLRVESDQVERANKSLDNFTGAAGRAEKAAKGMGAGATDAARKAAAANDNAASSATRAAAAYGKWHTVAIRMASVLGTIAGTLATAVVFRYADAWSDMQSRVGAAVRDMEAAPALMQRMVDIANASYSPLEQTVEIYARNVSVLRDLGRGATEAADFTEALNHALVLTATRGERAASVQNALSKAMAVGKLQAEGLETILAHGGEVAQVLADELGTSVNGLRAFASQGKITGDVIANSLITRLDDLRDRAGEMPATIGDAFVRIGTNILAFVGQVDQAVGASSALAEVLLSAADGITWLKDATLGAIANLDQIAEAAATAGVALGIAFGPAILASVQSLVVAVGTGMVTAFNALTAAMLANPMTAFAVAITAAVAAAYYFRDEIQKAIGVDVVGIAKTAANLVIGSFVAAYEDIKFVWNNFGDIMGAAVIGGVNIAIDAINGLVQKAAEGLDWLIGKINKIPGVNISEIGTVNPIDRIDNPYADRLEGSISERNAAVKAAMARDYIGELGAAFKTSEQAAADFGSAVAAANQSLENTGGGGGAADKAAKAIKGVADEAAKAAQAALDFGKDLVKGFVSDLRSGLEQGKGFWRSFGDAAMNVLDKIVDKLLNNVIDALFQVNSVGSRGGGGGGFLSGILGGIGRLFGFASGGYTGAGAASQPAGIVHAGEYVMSKTAVDRLGVGYLDALHNAAKGYQMGGYVRSHAPANLNMRGYQSGGYVHRPAAGQEVIKIELVSRFDADGGFEQAVERSSRPVAIQESAKAAGQVARAVPSMAIGAMDDSRTRRRRTISPGGGI